ncbi:MAG: hypothetical protein HYV26_21220 [Candidatus Hydrogenedentes bacterium]|nr:hypothetical protein [Candidatus Hydrogenedentota bacterium]
MSDPELREALLAREQLSPALKARHEQEVRKMMVRPLKWYERIAYACGCVLGLSFFGIFSWVGVHASNTLPPLAVAGFFLTALFGLAFAAVAFLVLRAGKLRVLRDEGLFTGLVWMFMVLMMTLFLVLGQEMEDTAKGTQMILIGLVFFVTFGVVGLLQYRIHQTESRVREAVLRVELQVAELAERLNLGSPPCR